MPMMEKDENIAGGFDFGYYTRNEHLTKDKPNSLKTTKTGTTIVGLCYDGGVVLAADTRATEGPIVADKNCEKIHYIAPNMYCCGAGTAADTEYTTNLIRSKVALHQLNSRRQVQCVTAMTMLKQHLFRHQGHIGAALILGGIDKNGPHLYTIYPHGSTDKLPYVTMGSGSLAAMSIFESGWKPAMSKEDAVELASRAILAGIFNDLGSGSNVDVVCIDAQSGLEIKRNLLRPNERQQKQQSYRYPLGSTSILNESVRNILVVEKEQVHMIEPN